MRCVVFLDHSRAVAPPCGVPCTLLHRTTHNERLWGMAVTAPRNRVGGRATRGAAPFSGPGGASQFPDAWCCVIPHPLRSSVPAQHPSHGSTGRRSRISGIWIRLSAHRRSSSTNSIGIRGLAKTPIAVINHYGCGRQLGRLQAFVWQTAFSSFRVGNVPGRLRSRARLGPCL